MTPRQTQMYFREWGKVRKHFTDQGIDPKLVDAKRHELHKRALGAMKSSKLFTNADLDKVLAVFYAITRPADLNTQLRQQDQEMHRLRKLRQDLVDLASRCVDKPGREGTYLDGMARKIFGPAQYHLLDETQLAQLRGILQQRIAQIRRKNEAPPLKQPVGAHAKAAQQADDSNCPW